MAIIVRTIGKFGNGWELSEDDMRLESPMPVLGDRLL
jgi:hypothetical protein